MTQTGEAPGEPAPDELASEAQSLEGYLCSCGVQEVDVNLFKKHMLVTSKDRSNHQSRGRVNFSTGEVIMPPAKDRTKEQWKLAKYGLKADAPLGVKVGGRPAVQVRHAEVLTQANQIRLVPRIYTIDYSPIMRAAHQAVIDLYGWPPEMPLGEILDRILHDWFKGKGVTLAGYIITETAEQKARRESAVAAKNNGGKPEPEEVKVA